MLGPCLTGLRRLFAACGPAEPGRWQCSREPSSSCESALKPEGRHSHQLRIWATFEIPDQALVDQALPDQALFIGGTGPFIVNGLRERGYGVTILPTGQRAVERLRPAAVVASVRLSSRVFVEDPSGFKAVLLDFAQGISGQGLDAVNQARVFVRG